MKLWLLVEDKSQKSALLLNERHWKLESYDSLSHGAFPSFTCISYSWGKGRQRSPFDEDFEISDRTIPSLFSALDSDSLISCIWIDALCVPIAEPERSITLQSMGHIYATAQEVVVVLSAETRAVLQTMTTSSRIETEEMNILEQDEWISRGWTYQETVNCKLLKITCLRTSGPSSRNIPTVAGDDFLNCLGFTLSKLPYSPHQRRTRYPNLDGFEDVIADYMTADYADRPALQVMGIMEKRVLSNPEDRIYAMIGAITKEPATAQSRSPLEAFIEVCEEKGDYSFLFSAADRDDSPGKRWRPKLSLDSLPAIVPWHIVGSRQPGRKTTQGLALEEVVVLRQEKLSDRSAAWIDEKLDLSKFDEGAEELPQIARVLQYLRGCGFTGHDECSSLSDGYFFPYKRLAATQDSTFIISLSLWWSFGAPGMVVYSGTEASEQLYMPGVFFGKSVSRDFQTVTLM
jgi:hypothetical protein